jgi:hypothetical protein
MTACPTVCVGFGEVRCVGVNVEDHVKGVKTDGGIAMSRKVIEELFAFFHCGFGVSGLFASNSTEGHEYSEVDGTGKYRMLPMTHCTCLMFSLERGEDVLGLIGRCAALPYCFG